MIIIWCFFCHEMIFVILYPAINFITSRIPAVKNFVSRSREDDFIPHSASNFLCIPHTASILSLIPHPAKPMLDPLEQGARMAAMRKAKPRNTVNPPDSEYETTPFQVLFSGWVYIRRGKEAMRNA